MLYSKGRAVHTSVPRKGPGYKFTASFAEMTYVWEQPETADSMPFGMD